MKTSHYDWTIKEQSEDNSILEPQLKNLGLPATLAPLLWNRGMKNSEELVSFLQPTLEALHDPYLLYDMEKTVRRIQQAVEQDEPIVIYGDYDADGVTSTTLMKEAIELIGGNVSFYLPNRFVDGYGPNKEVYRRLIEDEGVQLIITVDNGVSGHEALAYAREQGVDVIVTDHHELPEELPCAFSIIHPRHPSGDYPFGDLAGVGVAFKVATALLGELPLESLDLVAIGTIADLVSLTGENRVLVKYGLDVLKQTDRIGLQALASVSKVELTEANEETVGFSIGPRLNALGRLGDASPGVELLSTFDEEVGVTLANFIQQKNTERQEIVKQILTEAETLVEAAPKSPINILVKEGWHEGVLGIVASKIVSLTGKPTLILTYSAETGILKGSGRSIESVDLFQLLSQVKEHLISFGGHHMAAGLSFEKDKLFLVHSNLEQVMIELGVTETGKESLIIDQKLPLELATVSFIESMKQLAPFGTGNPPPLFLLSPESVGSLKAVGSDLTHLKCQLVANQLRLDCIAFGKGQDAKEFETEDLVEIVGSLSINEWNGNRLPQVMLKDYRVGGLQLFDLRGKSSGKPPFHPTKTVYLCFNEESLTLVKEVEEHSILVPTLTKEGMARLNAYEEAVIVDCPYNLEEAKQLFATMTINRLYFKVQVSQEHYLTGLPTREQFASLFKLVHSATTIDVRHKLLDISQFLKIEKKQLIFMINVFFELGFVTIEDGLMSKVEEPPTRPLDESQTYQEYEKKIEMEKLFLYSDMKDIKNWILQQEETK